MTGRWVGIWAAAPQPTEPPDLPPPPFTRDGFVLADSTLRQTIRVSAAAQRVRLRLSNAFGGTELSVDGIGLALPGGGQAGVRAIEPGTSRAVTFARQPGVVVAPGGQVVSDPLDFPVAAAANVTVTLYLAAGQPAAGGVTSHLGSRTTSYLAAGDHVADTDLPGAAAVEHWYLLGGVEACAGTATAAAVFLGDSLTDGRGSTTDGNDRWPDQLLDVLRSRGDSGGAALLNLGIGGNRVLRDGLGPSIVSRLDRDALALSGVRWLVLFAGVNDIGTADATQGAQQQVAAELCTAYEEIAAKAQAVGIAVCGATLTPFAGNDPYDDPAGHREAARQAVNAWIRASGRFGAVLDFDQAVRDPFSHRRLRPSFDSGDHLHLNPAGYRALADAVPASLFRLPALRSREATNRFVVN
ncbi:MAG TPA: SGNH/GDSL hydrolase family protein [Trebonia sp.]|nr:SGNH/GDSL hydrolase family protein [Trebonia sp.]